MVMVRMVMLLVVLLLLVVVVRKRNLRTSFRTVRLERRGDGGESRGRRRRRCRRLLDRLHLCLDRRNGVRRPRVDVRVIRRDSEPLTVDVRSERDSANIMAAATMSLLNAVVLQLLLLRVMLLLLRMMLVMM